MQQMIFIADLTACSTCFGAPLCPSSGAREYYTGGCCLWYLVVWFSSCRKGVELRVMCPVCGLQPANRTHHDFRHYKGGRSSAKRTGRLYPRRNSWYSFSETESTSGHMVLSDGTTEKVPSDTIGDLSRDRPTSSAAP
jgi:hypothetical protein